MLVALVLLHWVTETTHGPLVLIGLYGVWFVWCMVYGLYGVWFMVCMVCIGGCIGFGIVWYFVCHWNTASVVAESLPDSSYMPLRRIQLQGSLQNVLAEISNIPRMYFNNVGHALMRFCAIPTKLFLLVYYVLLCPADLFALCRLFSIFYL